MNAIKKRLQTLKLEKDLAMDKADLCDQQAKEANRREEKLRDEVRELAKKLMQMGHDLEVSKAQLLKSNKNLEMKERVYIVVSESDKCIALNIRFTHPFLPFQSAIRLVGKIADAVGAGCVEQENAAVHAESRKVRGAKIVGSSEARAGHGDRGRCKAVPESSFLKLLFQRETLV